MQMQIFSLPLNPKLNPNQFNDYCQFLADHKHWIYDVYFTSRIPPFDQDAMGDVFVLHEEGARSCIENALMIQETFKIPVSATFNNIHVRPDQKNLDIFIKHFKPLYDAGIRSATIPHTSWVLTGQLKKHFPDLFIKNTILREVKLASEVYDLAKAGFNYINLDRDLMRNRDELFKIKKVKKHFPNIKISLLANEGCTGGCPIMPEHYHYNCTRTKEDPQYFNSAIARISCSKWDMEDPAIMLKTANLPPWRDDWIELIDKCGIDTIKMHGRENIDRLAESMRIINRFSKNNSILFETFDEYLQDTNLKERPIDGWRKKIKNCKFDCWDCGYCDDVYAKKSGVRHSEKVLSVVDAVAFHDNEVLKSTDIPGLTSERVRKLIYNLSKKASNVLEIGCFLGATSSAILEGNPNNVYFIDHFLENIQPANGKQLPLNSKDEFIKNIKTYKKDSECKLFACDMFAVDKTEIQNIDLFFYDGPHDVFTTARAINFFSDVFAKETVLVFDDANFEGVVEGARKGIELSNLNITFEKIILNSLESEDEWWNGLYILVVRKR